MPPKKAAGAKSKRTKFLACLKDLTTVARIWYFLCFANVLVFFNYLPGLDATTTPGAQLAKMQVASMFSIACLYVAVAHSAGDHASQRKILQYGVGGYFLWVGGHAYEKKILQYGVGGYFLWVGGP